MHILIVAQFFPPDITAAAFRIGDMAKHFMSAGHRVSVFTTYPHKGEAAEGAADDPDLAAADIRRTRVPNVGSGGLVNYLAHYLSFLFGSLGHGVTAGLRGSRPDVVWASSPPLFAGLSGRVLSMLYRCPLVLDVRDIWPDCAVSAGQIQRGSRAFRLGRWLESYLYSGAQHITCVARPMREYIARCTQAPVTVVYNGVPERDGDLSSSSLPSAMGNSRRTLLYAGNLGRVQALDLLLEAWADVGRDDSSGDWRLRLIGAGALTGELKALADSLHLQDRVSIEPPMTRAHVIREMQSADVLYLSLKADDAFRLTIPSKIFDYLLAARPILAGVVGEGRDILEATGANLFHEPGNVDNLKSSLKEAMRRVTELERLADRNRTLVLAHYRRDQSADTLLDILERVGRKRTDT